MLESSKKEISDITWQIHRKKMGVMKLPEAAYHLDLDRSDRWHHKHIISYILGYVPLKGFSLLGLIFSEVTRTLIS
jgi:hypothetical protein